MGLIARKCFPNATQVIDRFHVQKLAQKLCKEIRINTAASFIDQKMKLLKKPRKTKKSLNLCSDKWRYSKYHQPEVAISHTKQIKWSKKPPERPLLFDLYP
jgi:transposase